MSSTPAPHFAPILALVKARDFTGALAAAERALSGHPDDPALLGIAALSALQLGTPDRAVPLLQRQLALAPHDRAARFNLATALAGLGRQAEALTLAQDYRDQPSLARLAGYLHQETGQLSEAIEAYRTALAALPRDWESWNNLGNCLVADSQTQPAISAFENAINRGPQPGKPELFINLSQALTATEDRDKRLRAAEEAYRRFPGHKSIVVELGLAQAAVGRMAEAERSLRQAADLETEFGEARIELGLLYENANRLDDLDALIAESETLGESAELVFLRAWSLRRRERHAEAALLAARIPDTINPIRTAQLRAELADRLGDHREAFRQYETMNAKVAESFPPLPGPSYRETIVAETAAMVAPATPPSAASSVGIDPIFIVGSPRSGTTLLDTLLGALPQLQVFEEKPMLAQVEREFPGLPAAEAAAIVAARARYFALAEAEEGPAEGRRIVDKHPLHLTHMPVIARLFPRAAIVVVERHPADAVLSCFMANFAPNHAMRSFTDLEEAARTYDAVFSNWRRAGELLPLSVHYVRYERMVADLEGEMRPLLAFLGLPWREEVLDNQASAARRGAVRTASYSQIGQPIYARAVGRWERYRPQLEPVLPILQPWIAAQGYDG